ncbi:fimbria/pilus periplasmic chaperone [Vibrio alfacsensis]|uniref:fimbria/pilus periplasmic chaperone n=1 Tax=Vibrio alfacsensis TaxID=1074311 RepID=UPI00406814C5
MRFIKLLVISIILMPIQVLAFELFPMVQGVDDLGKGTSTFFKVTNTSLAPLPLEITTSKRSVEFNNEETLLETDDLMVFPPQILIPPGKSQTIKVQYIGPPKPFAESYRLIVTQLPLKSESEKDAIQMLFRIGALVFVSPQSAQDNYVSEVKVNSENTPELSISNTGTSIIELSKHSYSVEWNGQKRVWNWEQLESLLPMQYLVPNQQVKVNAESLLTQ